MSHGVAYPLTHDVRRLLDLYEDIDKSLGVVLVPAVGLSQFAVRFRYPGEEPPASEEALVWDEVTRRLPALWPLEGADTPSMGSN